MRKQSADEVAAAARRRLALLGEELARSGYPRRSDAPDGTRLGPAFADGDFADPVTGEILDEPDDAVVEPAVLAHPGRHSRPRPAPMTGRGVAWARDRLPATLQGRVSLGSGHVAVLAVLAAVALADTAFDTVRARPAVETVPRAHVSAAGDASPVVQVAPAATPGATASASPSGVVVVDVAGKVRRPGIATLPAGSRVVDAIRHAGGAKRGVDLTSLNLARVLVDGEQILVGVPAAPGVAAAASSQPGSSSPDAALVNINSATLDQLDSLPGVGPVTAQKILDWRTAHGSFTAIDELLEVDGIGEKTLADMAPHLTL
jgi:competence protein ComEA